MFLISDVTWEIWLLLPLSWRPSAVPVALGVGRLRRSVPDTIKLQGFFLNGEGFLVWYIPSVQAAETGMDAREHHWIRLNSSTVPTLI